MQGTQENQTMRLPAVEALRGLAMSLVFLGHFDSIFRTYLPPGTASWYLMEYFSFFGHRGITFFLIITGYFVYGAFLKGGTRYFPFIKRRLIRICGVYWAVIALYLTLSVLLPSESRLPTNAGQCAEYILANMLLLQGFLEHPLITVSWAISYLVLIYVTIPAVIRSLAMSRWRSWQRVLLIITGAVMWLSLCYRYPQLSPRVVIAAVGMLIWEALNYGSLRCRMTAAGELSAIVLLFVALNARYLYEHKVISLPDLPLRSFYEQLLTCLGTFYFCAYVFSYSGILAQKLCRPMIVGLGRMGYSYYLLHGVVLKGIAVLVSPISQHYMAPVVFWVLLPTCYFATLGVARMFFRAIEEPLARAMSSSKDRLVKPDIPTTNVEIAAAGRG